MPCSVTWSVCRLSTLFLLASFPAVSGLAKPAKPTAVEVFASMGRGINLGNVYDFDTGNDASFPACKKMIDLFQTAGFGHVRVPVTWGDSFDVSSEKTMLVTSTVQYALSKGLYVILNTHHERWLKDKYNDTAFYNDRFASLWTGIATHFADVGNKLIFEILNEPDGVLGGWGPDHADPFHARSLSLTRAVNEVGYRAVRNVSKDRVVTLMPNGMGSQSLIQHVYPNPSFLPEEGADPYLAVSVHTYDPWEFCGETGKNTHFPSFAAMQAHMSKIYGALADWQYKVQIPMHVGEYGFGRVSAHMKERDTDLARTYYKFVANTFALHGWPSTVWDDQGWFALVSNFTFIHGFAEAVLSTY